MIKTILALREGVVPPHPTFEEPNPKLGLETSPFRVDAKAGAWESNETPRRAGVSSFGIGGTNAHAVVEQAPPVPASEPSEPWQLLMLSARTPMALERAAGNLQRHLQIGAEQELADAAFTLSVGRRPFPYRRVVVARDREEAVETVASASAGLTSLCDRRNPPVSFLLPGQGAQEVGMVRGAVPAPTGLPSHPGRGFRSVAPPSSSWTSFNYFIPRQNNGRPRGDSSPRRPSLNRQSSLSRSLWLAFGRLGE